MSAYMLSEPSCRTIHLCNIGKSRGSKHHACLRCSARSTTIRRSAAASRTEHMTPASAIILSRTVAPKRSGIPSDQWQSCPPSRCARKPGPRRPPPPVRPPETKLCAHRNIWAPRFGGIGAATAAGAASRQKCTASNCWANASWRGTLIVRLRISKPVLSSRMAKPLSAYLWQRLLGESVRGNGRPEHQPVCATESRHRCARQSARGQTPWSSIQRRASGFALPEQCIRLLRQSPALSKSLMLPLI